MYAPCPRSPNVHDILKQFCERYKKELPPSFAAELTEGLKSYFTKALSTVLLFTVERDDLLTVRFRSFMYIHAASSRNSLNRMTFPSDPIFSSPSAVTIFSPQLVQRHGGDPCAVLGAEHFLRLFVKLPEIMPVGDLTEDAREGLQAALNLLLSFLDNKKKLFFTKVRVSILLLVGRLLGASA